MDITELLEELKKDIHDFKAENDKRIDAIEAKGTVDPLLTQKVDKINDHITEVEKQISEYKALQTQVDELEARFARPSLGAAEEVALEIKNTSDFFSNIGSGRGENKIVTPTEAQIEQYKNYRPAFLNYMRYGKTGEYFAALEVGTDPLGGYWVMPDTTGRIATLIFETSPIRQIAAIQIVGTDTLEGFNDLDEATSGGWVGEKEARPDTATPNIGKWSIPVHEQYAQPKSTQKMLDDAFNNPEQWLERKVADKLARTENNAFVLGDGILKPRGFLTYAAGTPTSALWNVIQQTNSGAAGAFKATDSGDPLIDLVFTLKQVYRTGARWVMARATLAAVRKLKDGQGNYLWERDFSNLQGTMVLGFPVTEGEDMPAIAGNSLSIAFGNFSLAYQIVDRSGIRILRDPFTDKPNVRFYTTKRVGGAVVNFEAIKIMKFAI